MRGFIGLNELTPGMRFIVMFSLGSVIGQTIVNLVAAVS